MTTAPGEGELVVLLDEDGNAIGTADKAAVHTEETPLHQAFSCYIFDDAGRLLITRRALDKATFPGVWTNSVCGHPAPRESLTDAIRRRAADELGLLVTELQLVLPRFRYDARAADGVLENEMCPVFVARCDDPSTLTLAPTEVAELAWVFWPDFRDDVLTGVREVSEWCAKQVSELTSLELPGGGFPTASPRDLPSAASL
jgi:isopentenyl-diphosphate delta-isomerase